MRLLETEKNQQSRNIGNYRQNRHFKKMQNNFLSFNWHCSALGENWRNGIDVIFHCQLL